jgi:hypothetical protein
LTKKYDGKLIHHDHLINKAIDTLTVGVGRKPWRRDGWIFQMISWIAVYIENSTEIILTQPPHDAPGQHGIDGLAVVLDNTGQIKTIIITEDKCSSNPRPLIDTQVWPEFAAFEKGEFDNKMVSRVSAMLNHVDEATALEMVNKDIFRYEIRRYRVGTTPLPEHKGAVGRAELFKDYDGKVKGADVSRRYAATFENAAIRTWMEKFAKKIIVFLESKKTTYV